MKRLKKVESRRSAGPTLGVLIAELDAAPRRGTTTRAVLSERTPDFVDDAVRAGLQFTFDNGVSTVSPYARDHLGRSRALRL